jgi:hypothetical protein
MPPRRAALAAVAASLLTASAPALAGPPPSVATSPATLGVTLSGVAKVEELPGGYAVALPEPFTPPADATDPIYRKPFSRAVYVYAPSAADGKLVRRVVIHHEPESRDDAARAARLIARLLRLHAERFARTPTFPREADAAQVWLLPEQPGAASGSPALGGETRDANVYVFGTGTKRSPLEWARTLAHEWGHLTLPAARGFTEPETDAAGLLGERLHFKWLREDARRAKSAPSDDFLTADGPDLYYKRQVAPLIARFAEGGPSAKALTGDGAAAMDYYCGAVLACDDAFGPALTGRALFAIEGVRPADFLAAMSATVARADAVSVRLPAWVPLSRTRYVVAPAPGGGSGAVRAGTTSVTVGGPGATLRVTSSGWRWMRAADGRVSAVVLRPADRPEAGR